MTRPTKTQIGGVSLAAAAALIGLVGVAAARGGEGVLSAIESAATATDAVALANQVPILAAGGALIGLGVGVIVAGGAMYWYQTKQIEGRLA